MGRKKSRSAPPPAPPRPREEPFHSPFRDIREQLHAIESTRPAAPPAAAPTAGAPAPPPPPPPPARSPKVLMQREKAVFLAEMAGVTPLPKDPRGRVEKPQLTPKPLYLTDDYEALADLRDLVEGRGEFTIQYTDENREGLAPGGERGLSRRLTLGDYAVQAHIDLHGHTVEEA